MSQKKLLEERIIELYNQGLSLQKVANFVGYKSANSVKNILIKYYPASSSNELNSVLFDIFTCEQDLASHNYIEDYLFIPVIQTLEYNIERKK